MFKCIEAKDEDLIKEIYRFRYRIACIEEGIFDRKSFPNECETDEFDQLSIQYAIFDKENNLAACVRLVHHSKRGYPTSKALKINPEEEKKLLPYNQMGELSRIFIRKDCRGIKNTKQIIDLVKINAGAKMKELGIVSSFGSLEESFLRLLLILKMPYRPIGPYQVYGNRMRAPCIMLTDELIELNKELFFEEVH